MSKFWERFFYLLTYASQGSSYLSPKGYAILHRMHHAYSDTPKDPHSPHHTKNMFTMMLKTKDIYNNYTYGKEAVPMQFDRNYPVIDWVEKLGSSWFSRIGWGTLYVLFYVAFADYWWLYLLLPIHFLMGPVHGAIVNWSGHKYGYQNFNNNDQSRNSLVFDFLMMGELFQNNHHKLPKRANFGVKWYEFDPTYPVIRVLDWMKTIKLQRKSEGREKKEKPAAAMLAGFFVAQLK
jgi:stearoyl-CoA desaturase (Delta-9 desaturase)